MKILTTKNGIALIAVLALLLVLTLFLPTMFTMSEISMQQAVVGTDAQRSSYLARTVTEMSVASFKKSYDKIKEKTANGTLNADAQLKKVSEAYDKLMRMDVERNEYGEKPAITEAEIEANKIVTETVKMYYDLQENTFVYATYSGGDTFAGTPSRYDYMGDSTCTITFDDSVDYYKIDSDTKEATKLSGYSEYKTYLDKINAAISAGTATSSLNYSVSRVENKNVCFNTVAKVKGQQRKRSCIVVLPTYPGEQEWLVFDGAVDANDVYKIVDGCNQAQADPQKATGRMVINYSDAGVEDYKAQALQIYSCLGNMLINTNNIKDKNGRDVICGRNYSELILGVQPRLNTEPDDDPTFAIIQGINGATYSSAIQKDNFVAFTSTNAIQVDLPINLLVNGLRGNRAGDGIRNNESIYKVMMFQSPTIYFSRSVDMMISLYRNTLKDRNARRMSTVILMAPANTPYSYFNVDRQTTVKAGMVYFAEDCYLWVINYGDNGTGYSNHWYEVQETVYMRDTDFQKVKIANAGDVYYFNTEVQMEKKTDSQGLIGRIIGRKNRSGQYQYAGLPLTAYALETIYLENYDDFTSSDGWWEVWKNTRQAMFGFYMRDMSGLTNNEKVYVHDDLHKIGNVYENDNVEFPEIDDFYTIWSN